MAFSARRSLASGLSRHLTRRFHPSLSHLVPSHHDRREDPSCSSPAPPNPTQQPSLFPSGDLRRRSRSQNLTLPLPFGAHLAAHRSFSSGPEADAAAGVLSDPAAGQMDVAAGVLSGAASSAAPAFPAPFPGEVAAAAADSFLPVAAVQYLIDGVHSFTGLNWWASIALAAVLVRMATIPQLVHQIKYDIKYKALIPEVKAINKDMLHSTDLPSRQERKMKLDELYRKHGVSHLTPFKYLFLFIQVTILLSFIYAIRNMIEKVPSMEGGGAYWFTNLKTPDELYILPVLISIAYAVQEINMKARLAGSPMQQKIEKNVYRALCVLIIPVSMSFCKAHFFYWVPWTLFSLASGFAFRQPAVRRYFGIPLVAPPRPARAAPAPASKGPKPVPPSADSPAAANGPGQPSSEPMEKSVNAEKKRRTPRVITNREK